MKMAIILLFVAVFIGGCASRDLAWQKVRQAEAGVDIAGLLLALQQEETDQLRLRKSRNDYGDLTVTQGFKKGGDTGDAEDTEEHSQTRITFEDELFSLQEEDDGEDIVAIVRNLVIGNNISMHTMSKSFVRLAEVLTASKRTRRSSDILRYLSRRKAPQPKSVSTEIINGLQSVAPWIFGLGVSVSGASVAKKAIEVEGLASKYVNTGVNLETEGGIQLGGNSLSEGGEYIIKDVIPED